MQNKTIMSKYLNGLDKTTRLLGIFAAVFVLPSETLLAQSVSESGNDVVPANIENPVPAAQESIAAGAELFSRACATCHGLDARGSEFETEIADPGPNPPSLIDARWDYGSTDGEIFWNVSNGIYPYMDKYGDTYQEQQIWNIINYLRSISTSD